MDGEGLGTLKNLPDDELRMVLKKLKFSDLGNMRRGSKRLKNIVTNLSNAAFNTFYIKGIDASNCEDITRTLARAMAEDQAPEKLQLEFRGELNAVMRDILLDYMELITSLTINVFGNNKVLLLKQSTVLESLDSLRLFFSNWSTEDNISVGEVMLSKHAHNLKNLVVEDLNENLSVPVLPVIETLVLCNVEDEAAQSLLEQSRNTITSFTILGTNIKLTSSAAYKIQNLNHLCLSMNTSNAFKFVLRNANNLESLDLGDAKDISVNMTWPEFPKLRELCIGYSERLLPIFSKSKDTLEQLIMDTIPSADNAYAVVMPKLTDLYTIRANHEFINNILRLNCKSLEFLYVNKIALSYLDYGRIKMNRLKRVVLGSLIPNYSEEERARLIIMCPNAEIVLCKEENLPEIRGKAKDRCKRKKFSIDTKKLMS